MGTRIFGHNDGLAHPGGVLHANMFGHGGLAGHVLSLAPRENSGTSSPGYIFLSRRAWGSVLAQRVGQHGATWPGLPRAAPTW